MLKEPLRIWAEGVGCSHSLSALCICLCPTCLLSATDPPVASTATVLVKEKLVYSHPITKWKLAAPFGRIHFVIVQVVKTSTKSFKVLL